MRAFVSFCYEHSWTGVDDIHIQDGQMSVPLILSLAHSNVSDNIRNLQGYQNLECAMDREYLQPEVGS